MQVFVLLAIVASAVAAPTFVVNSAPIAHLPATTYSHAIPSTFYSSSIAHLPATTYSHAIPSTFYSSSFAHGAIPTTYSAGVPTTYLAGSHFPSVYSAGA